MPNKCIYEGCNIRSSYGKEGCKFAEFCNEHKPIDYVNVNCKKCIYQGCRKQPTYGEEGSKLAEYCDNHKPVDYINIKDKKCIHQGCNIIPSYGKEGSKLAEYCDIHKPDNTYVDVKHKKCIHENCNIRPNYGKEGSKLAEYCVEHKPDEYVNVNNKKCIYQGCSKQPTYGKEGSKLAEYCDNHKPDDTYVNIVSNKCIHQDCNTRPLYGKKGSKLKEYCVDHKPDETYIDIVSNKCKECNTIPSFGKKGSKLAEYCNLHKPFDYVDVKHKHCIHENCKSRQYYGPLFQPKIHCGKHKTKNEYKNNNPKCCIEKCKEMPCFTDQNDNYPLRCEDHKLENDVNVVLQKCNNCKLEYFIKTGNLCNVCSDFNNPKIRHAKELEIKQLLDANGIIYDSHDKIPKYSCNKERPDFVIDNGLNMIVIEVDENQHHSYEKKCEEERMINISQDFGGVPTIFIRYNPDKYKNINNEVIKSKTGRHKRLLETINGVKLHPNTNILSVVYLFYNGDNGCNKIEEIEYH